MSQPYVGEIIMFGGNFAPAGWAMCQGQLMPISENDALFNLIGTTYGGDGQTTFALPDLRGRVPIHIGGTGNFQLGQMGGVEQVTLTVNQMPTHTHTAQAATSGSSDNPSNNFWAGSSTGKAYAAAPPSVLMNPATANPVGGSQPHENMVPFLSVTYIISLFGIFPSQT